MAYEIFGISDLSIANECESPLTSIVIKCSDDDVSDFVHDDGDLMQRMVMKGADATMSVHTVGTDRTSGIEVVFSTLLMERSEPDIGSF